MLLRIETKYKSRYVYCDDEYMGPITLKELSDIGVNTEDIGASIYETETDEDISERIRTQIINKCFDKGMTYLSRAEYCAKEIAFKLKSKGYPDFAVNSTIALLYEFRYLNDKRFAEAYIRSNIYDKSRSLILKELDMKDISHDVSGTVIDGIYEDMDLTEDVVIEHLIEKKSGCVTTEEMDDKTKRKLMQFLLRRGFGFSEINKHLT